MAIALKIPQLDDRDYVRFWSKATLTANPDKCWEWNGRVRSEKKPYGQFDGKDGTLGAPRVAYYLYYNTNPSELHVLHKCDNPRCVNPHHLFLGTNADNMADKVKKNRQSRTEAWNKGKELPRLWDNRDCLATKEQFIEMKAIYEKGGISLDSIAKKYGTSKKALSSAIKALGGSVQKHHTVLTKEQVLAIRARYIKNEVSSKLLSKEYGVGGKTIMDIVHFKTWANI